MISNKNDLKEYILADMYFYHAMPSRDKFVSRLTHDPLYEIVKYLRLLRKEEYYFNCRKDKLGKMFGLSYLKQKNKLGNRLGFKIPRNTFGKGLMIYHHGSIIINENVSIGENARLHGENCIGNNGRTEEVPRIGNNLDLGVGAKVIGGVTIGNDIRIGANAVVIHSFSEDHITLAGIPAKRVK